MSPSSRSRREFLRSTGSTLLLIGAGGAGLAAEPLDRMDTIATPIDHRLPAGARFPLRYRLLQPFDAGRPTVFVIADGQQFYVTPRTFAPAVAPIFGDACNVVGVFGRADAPEVQRLISSGMSIDWREAYRLLRADQWIEDIETVRQVVVGAKGRIGLYGRSGGGLLVHQYMARHGQHVDHVFTQAAVNPFLQARFGLRSDHFWEELASADRARLSRLLVEQADARLRIARLFQRQNFFVERARLDEDRARLITELSEGRADRIAAREADYQIDALIAMDGTARGVASRVRLFEFFAPVAPSFRPDPLVLRPDLEVSAAYAEPLMRLADASGIDAPSIDFAALHALPTEVFLLAGRWDHTCDYRTQIALASIYPTSQLVVLDDDHTFHRLQAAGKTAQLVQGVFEGFSSSAHDASLRDLEPMIWRERG